MWGDVGRYGGAILLSSLPSSMASKDTSAISPLFLPYVYHPISPHISSYLLAVVDGVEGAEQLERQRLGAEVRVRVREGSGWG